MNHNQKVGQFGEDLAIKYLLKNKYKIIDRNVKISYKELDIIAKIKDKIIFIEVKTRTSQKFGFADESINSKKLHHLKKAINMYLDNKDLDPDKVRLDLIAIDINKSKKTAKIKHYKDLF